MSKPFFSIIIPTYNRADLITDTVQSILNQKYLDFEIIIIDDGSTDNTKEIIENIFSGSNKIRYFYQTNAERGAARNNGFKNANGKYVIFFDSDDLMLPNHLTSLYKVIVNNPELKFLSTKFSYSINGKIKSSSSHALKGGWNSGEIFLEGGATGIMICILKNNPSLKPFIEDKAYSTLEDWMYLVQNIINERIFIIDEVTVLVNDHPARSMRADNIKIINKRLLATEWIIKNISLSEKQINILLGNSDLFCSVHSYADNNKHDALSYLKKSVRNIGVSLPSILLFVKILLGYNFIQKLK